MSLISSTDFLNSDETGQRNEKIKGSVKGSVLIHFLSHSYKTLPQETDVTIMWTEVCLYILQENPKRGHKKTLHRS